MLIKGTCIFLVLMIASSADAIDPEKEFTLTPLQQDLRKTHSKWVVPAEERVAAVRHLFRLKTLSFDNQADVLKQIEAYENKNREGYDDGPFYVHNETGKKGQDSGWEKWQQEIFTIEQDWAEGLMVPYFCQVLKLSDEQGKPVNSDNLSAIDRRKLGKATIREILKPLSSKSADQMRNVPIYVVQYRGNFSGNCKFVKLYVGKEGTADFLVFDVSVYDQY